MITLNGKVLTIGKFPNGETYLDVPEDLVKWQNGIVLKYESDSDLLQLGFLAETIREKISDSKIFLTMPYLPYSRMDRQENDRIFSLKMLGKFLNSLNLDMVQCGETHSPDVTKEYIDHFVDTSLSLPMANYLVNEEISKGTSLSEILVVFPDKGAAKRYEDLFKKYQPDIQTLTFDKKRDFNTGKILEIAPEKELDLNSCKVAFILDDLCSKGGTFVSIANKLREMGAKRIELVVTHAENTVYKGRLFETIDQIHTTESILDLGLATDAQREKIRIHKGL